MNISKNFGPIESSMNSTPTMRTTNFASHRGQTQLPLPDRIPTRPPEGARYRTASVPADEQHNFLYLAVPSDLSEEELLAMHQRKNGEFDVTVRTRTPAERREALKRLSAVIFPMKRHWDLHRHIRGTIRDRYANLNPTHGRFLEDAVEEAKQAAANQPADTGAGSVGAGAIIGEGGNGKSESVKRELIEIPQLVRHTEFEGRAVRFEQIVWMFTPCPPKASGDGLLYYLCGGVDRLMKTSFRTEMISIKNHSRRLDFVSLLMVHVQLGTVILDEFQNAQCGTAKDREVFENTLLELINRTRTKFICVGTPDALAGVRSEPLSRRLVGDKGLLKWPRLAGNLPHEWPKFFKQMWKWQYTREETPLDSRLSLAMYVLSGGIPDYAKKIWVAAQDQVIGQPCEIITVPLLKKVVADRFYDRHAVPRLDKALKQHARGEMASEQ